jgi:hypothetical protein
MKLKHVRVRLTLVCTVTGEKINTGVAYTDLKRVKMTKLLLHCCHCGKSHVFKFTDAHLKPTRHRELRF